MGRGHFGGDDRTPDADAARNAERSAAAEQLRRDAVAESERLRNDDT